MLVRADRAEYEGFTRDEIIADRVQRYPRWRTHPLPKVNIVAADPVYTCPICGHTVCEHYLGWNHLPAYPEPSALAELLRALAWPSRTLTGAPMPADIRALCDRVATVGNANYLLTHPELVTHAFTGGATGVTGTAYYHEDPADFEARVNAEARRGRAWLWAHLPALHQALQEDADATDLVYGVIDTGAEWQLNIIPRRRAEELATLFDALHTARTWGEFGALVSVRHYGEALALATAASADQATVPAPGDPFDERAIHGGDPTVWPGWPTQEMLTWLPADIQQQFGREDCGVIGGSGPLLVLAVDRVEQIIAALVAHGYQCNEEEGLVERALGIASAGVYPWPCRGAHEGHEEATMETGENEAVWVEDEDVGDGGVRCPLCGRPAYAYEDTFCVHVVLATDHDEFWHACGHGTEFVEMARRLAARIEDLEDADIDLAQLPAPPAVRQTLVAVMGVPDHERRCYWAVYPGVQEESATTGGIFASGSTSYYFHPDPATLVTRVHDEAQRAVAWLGGRRGLRLGRRDVSLRLADIDLPIVLHGEVHGRGPQIPQQAQTAGHHPLQAVEEGQRPFAQLAQKLHGVGLGVLLVVEAGGPFRR